MNIFIVFPNSDNKTKRSVEHHPARNVSKIRQSLANRALTPGSLYQLPFTCGIQLQQQKKRYSA